jgi:voltage-gated potassium channel
MPLPFSEKKALSKSAIVPSPSMTLQQKVRFYLEDIETPIGRWINISIIGLVLLSSGIFVAQTYPISTQLRSYLDGFNQVILVLFSIEYLLRLWSSDRRVRYVFSLYGLIDLLAILPFLLTTVDISFIRVFRWFRVLRLIRFIEGKTIFGYVSREDSVIFVRILFTLFTIIFVYSGLIYQVEHPVNSQKFSTFLDAIYFSVATMTTVGFGDITPVSEIGQLLTVLMILTGIALIPWQLGDLIKQLVKTSKQLEIRCENCGLDAHDADAKFCKACGNGLLTTGIACEISTQKVLYPIENRAAKS